MKKLLAKQTIWSYLLLASTVLLIPGFIIFLVNSTTGYLAGSKLSALVITLTVLALIVGIIMPLFGEKLHKFSGIGALLIAVMVGISIAGIAWTIEGVAADIFFIPVNYPESENGTWALGVTSVVFYLLSFLSAMAACFGKKLFKEED